MSVKELKQGGLANSSGSTLEKTIVGTLVSKGFNLVSYSEWKKKPEKYGDEFLITNYPYETIYGHKGKTEFLLKSSRYNLEIRIECKWQQSSGSVDEKFPYLYLNCIEKMPEKKIFIVIDGGGAKAGSVSWLREAANSKKYLGDHVTDKEISVMSLSDFLIWANKNLR